MTIIEATRKVRDGAHLSREEARAAMHQLLEGGIPDSEIANFLVALREKGEQAVELAGFAEVMRARAAQYLETAGVEFSKLRRDGPLLDTCGTGGDGRGTFNVSTATALVAAAAGVRVAKHGNRSISSQCGSADVLEALGVSLELPLHAIPACLEEAGIVFLFAPQLHLSMKHVMNARRSLKSKTVFNLLGPLTNPLQASAQLVGVYDRRYTPVIAEVLREVGTSRALVVTGYDGMDEITTTGPTQASEANEGSVHSREILPEDFGLKRVHKEALRGGDAETNAALMRRVFEGRRDAYRDVVLANASAALVVAGAASGFLEGVERAAEAIDSGAAAETLRRLAHLSQQLKSQKQKD